MLRSQCLHRHQLKSDIAVFEWQSRARIKWMFTIEKARAKMGGPTSA